jgi:septal ring factor EnvC (AmiA/AmiB activator)
MIPGADEVGKTTRSFFDALKDQPLSLALVVMNFALVAYMFYSGGQLTTQRAETTKMIVDWQQKTDTLMANCVSAEVTKLVLDNLQRTTETMLNAEQKEIARMQQAINEERQRNNALNQRLLDALTRSEPPPKLQRNISGPLVELLPYPGLPWPMRWPIIPEQPQQWPDPPAADVPRN